MGTALSRKEQEELAALNGESPPALSAQEQAELDALNGGPAPAAAAAPAAPAAPAQPKKEPGFFEGLAARMQDKPLGSRLTGAGKVFRDSMTPEERQADTERAGAIYNKYSNVMTFGVADKIRDAVGDSSTPESRKALEEKYPLPSKLGTGLGVVHSATGGGAKVLDNLARGAVAKAVPALASTAKGLLPSAGRVVGASAAGALSGGTAAAIESGGDAEAMKRGGAFGGILGAAGQTVGEVASAGAQYLKGLPWISRYLKYKDNGLLGEAEAATKSGALPKGRDGIQKASEKARDDIFVADEKMTEAARGRVGGKREPELGKPMNMSPVRQNLLEEGVDSRPLSAEKLESHISDGTPGDFSEGATDVVDQHKKVLGKLRNEPTVKDALQARSELDEASGFGAPSPSDAQLAARKARSAVRAGIRKASPKVAEADDEFTAFKQKQNRRNDILTGREEGGRLADAPPRSADEVEAADAVPITKRVQDEKTAAQRLRRIGDQSVEGRAWDEFLQELRKQEPEFAAAIDRLEAKKAYEATRFALKPPIQDNLDASVGSVPIPGFGAGTMRFFSQWGNAAGARFGLPVAESLEGAGTVGMRAAPVVGEETATKKERARKSKR